MFTNSFGLLVVGSRSYSDYRLFSEKLDHLLENVEQYEIHIITGDTSGVSEMAKKYANEHGCVLHTFYAAWQEYGKSAGFERNKSMFKYLIENFQHPGCFAMLDEHSAEMKQGINLARYWKVPLRVFNPIPKSVPAPEHKEPEFVSAPKWLQDDPNISEEDKELVHNHLDNTDKQANDSRYDNFLRTVEYVEESEYAKRKKRQRLLARAARLADMYDLWAEPSWA